MQGWSYKVLRIDYKYPDVPEEDFSEFYICEDFRKDGRTDEILPSGESLDSLIWTLEEMLKAAKQTLRGEKGIMIKEVEL